MDLTGMSDANEKLKLLDFLVLNDNNVVNLIRDIRQFIDLNLTLSQVIHLLACDGQALCHLDLEAFSDLLTLSSHLSLTLDHWSIGVLLDTHW